MAFMLSSGRAAVIRLKISRSGIQNNIAQPLFRVVRSTRRVDRFRSAA
jgi:hypothetical protein